LTWSGSWHLWIKPDFLPVEPEEGRVKEPSAPVAKLGVIECEKAALKRRAVHLIEWAVAILILGTVAVPEFIDLSGETDTALEAVVGAINSAAALNYVGAKAGDVEAVHFNDGVDSCDSMIRAVLEEGAMPDGYRTETRALNQNDGDIIDCRITQNTDEGDNSMVAKVVWVE